MYNIADKIITGCKFDFAIFAILTLHIPIACFDMNVMQLHHLFDGGLFGRGTILSKCGESRNKLTFSVTSCVV